MYGEKVCWPAELQEQCREQCEQLHVTAGLFVGLCKATVSGTPQTGKADSSLTTSNNCSCCAGRGTPCTL